MHGTIADSGVWGSQSGGYLPMLRRKALFVLVGLGCCLAIALGQQSPVPPAGTQPASAAGVVRLEFPVVLQQNVAAGKTPVGTHVQGDLVIGTLFNGKVIPRNAVLSGEVVESKARSASEPSRLSIRMDSARWKDGSATIQVYLTSWYYPVTADTGPNLQYGPEQSAKRTWNGMGQYPDSNSRGYKPFPAAGDTDDGPSAGTPSSVISKRPIAMKNVEFERNRAGGITLVSKRANLKLDKLTTYILASGDALPPAAE